VIESQIRAVIVAERVAWIRKMVNGIRLLPVASYDEFMSDPRNVAAAESYLRRALEAVLDLGRHVLAKGFALAATEYKEIGRFLVEAKVLTEAEGQLLRRLAGYRNRLVHFYHDISTEELYQIATEQLQDVERVMEAILSWLMAHPDKVDQKL
jgi:uncharacterized protein YutE (UPF0331/DUF86 family)